jgi:hypothetical protein
MAENQETGQNPTAAAEQLAETWQDVREALQEAAQRISAGSHEVGLCALKQAEQNSAQLFDTLRAMASTKNPTEVASLYSRFITESAQQHAEQLREMGEILAKSGRESWEPVADAIASARWTPKS